MIHSKVTFGRKLQGVGSGIGASETAATVAGAAGVLASGVVAIMLWKVAGPFAAAVGFLGGAWASYTYAPKLYSSEET